VADPKMLQKGAEDDLLVHIDCKCTQRTIYAFYMEKRPLFEKNSEPI